MNTREQIWADAMRAGRRGDGGAYERLLGEVAVTLRKLVRAKLVRRGVCVEEAEDVLQEVLIGVHIKRHTWDEDRAFLPWLNAIVYHKLFDAVRRLRREARYRIDLGPEDWNEAFAAPLADPDRGLVDLERHLRDLPQSQRDVVRALAVEGQTVQATAARLRTSEGVVRMTLHRALDRIAASVRTIGPPVVGKQR